MESSASLISSSDMNNYGPGNGEGVRVTIGGCSVMPTRKFLKSICSEENNLISKSRERERRFCISQRDIPLLGLSV